MKGYLLIILMLITGVLQGQKITPVYYQLSHEEARQLIESKWQFNDSFLHTPIEGILDENQLANGYYLKMEIRNEVEQINLINSSNLSIHILPNDRDLVVSVLDALDRPIPNATVHFGEKKLKYDNISHTYFRKRSHLEKTLKIEANGEIVFLPVINGSPQYYKRRWQQLKGRSVVKVVSFPVTLLWRTYHFFKRIIQYGHLSFYALPQFRKRPHLGYIVSNKPIYRPGDTLKVKLFFTKKNGHPWKKDIDLRIIQSPNYKKIATLPMTKLGSGNYAVNFPLPKDIKLDTRLDLHPLFNKSKRANISMSVKIEDYQLDQTSYQLSSSKKNYIKGEKIILKATARDKNGQNIVDGQLKMIVTASATNWQQTIYLADTLWRHKQALRPKAGTQIVLPDSIFPNANMTVKINAWFVNSRGETKNKSLQFTYDNLREYAKPDLKIEENFLVINTGDPSKSYGLKTILSDGKESKTKPVKLPFREKIATSIALYELYLEDKLVASLDMTRRTPPVYFEGHAQNDSLFIQLDNSMKLPIHWQLLAGKKQIKSGFTQAASFQWKGRNHPSKQYKLLYQFTWAGKPQSREVEILNLKKKLDITLYQPIQTAPGTDVPLKIKVTDYKGRPASGVNLSAVTINSTFEGSSFYNTSKISYKTPKNRFLYNNYHLQSLRNYYWKRPIDSFAYRHFNLGKQLYYQLRHPQNGVFIHTDSTEMAVPQLAPFIVKNGVLQPIYMIYCNRKLVYYYGSDSPVPYAFKARPGINKIDIRTLNAIYTINVSIKEGQKLLLSIDEDNYSSNTDYPIIKRKMPTELNPQEKQIIGNSLLTFQHLQTANYYVWNQNGDVYQFRQNNTKLLSKIGPFMPNDTIYFQIRGGFKTSFIFEPGFKYEISPQRQRLYQYEEFPSRHHYLPSIQPRSELDDTLLSTRDIQRNLPWIYPIIDKIPDTVYASSGRIKFDIKNLPEQNIDFIALQKFDSSLIFFNAQYRAIGNLQPGNYTLFVGTIFDKFIQKNIVIKANTTTLLPPIDWQNAQTMETGNPLWQQLQSGQKRPQISYKEKKYSPKKYLYYSDSRMLSGIVTDQTNPLIGASVYIKGTNIGTTTDFDGYFELLIPDHPYELVVSYTGYHRQEIGLKSGGIVDIRLTESVALQEVVVSGLGIKRDRRTMAYATLSGKTTGISIRGSRSSATKFHNDGLNIISPLNQLKESFNSNAAVRSNFRDDALWSPSLITDKNGETYLHYRLPDDITAWNTTVIGMDKKKRIGIGQSQIKSILPITAELAMPRFLLAGDEVNIIGKTVNYTQDSFALTTRFEQEGQLVQKQYYQLKDYVIDSVSIIAPNNQDSLHLTYQVETKNYADGEKRQVVLHPVGTKETLGQFYILEKDTNIIFRPRQNTEKVELYFAGSQVNALIDIVDDLIIYPYGCNEQLSSKLIALLLKKQINSLRGLPFTESKTILEIIAKLQKSQNANGAWGWWKNGTSSNWITHHVIKALSMAREQGYDSPPLEKARLFITSNIGRSSEKSLLADLLLLKEAGQNMDYQSYIRQIDPQKLNLYNQLQLLLLKQSLQMPYSVDSLLQKGHKTLHGGLYFGEKNYRFFNNDILPGLLAYEFLQKEGKTAEATQIQRYLIEQKQSYNTYLAASVLSVLLPDMLQKYDFKQSANINLLQGDQMIKIDSFPFSTQLNAQQNIELQKQGTGPVYATIYQTIFNKNPQPKTNFFKVSSHLKQGNRVSNHLKKGSSAQLIVEVSVEREAEYVLIEIPIPAGTSYYSKVNNRRYPEVHREYFREKTAIFCQKLKKGNYTFTIDLEPRFTGKYTLNPVKVEEMYFPVFYGQNGIKQVEISH